MAKSNPLQVYCVRRWIVIVFLITFLFPVVRPEEAFAVTSSYAQAQRTILKIDTKKKMLLVYRGSVLYRNFPVALGKQSTPTPVGAWKVIDRQKNWGSGFGTRWIRLNVPWGIYGIHGTNKPYSIGYFTSGGCIRMHNSDVEQLYEWVRIGTPVIIEGNPFQPLRLLREGDIGADVQLIQKRLEKLGFYHGDCHGRFDFSTEEAVKKFETASGLPANGIVEYRDLKKLKML